jgi:hypothetical protein
MSVSDRTPLVNVARTVADGIDSALHLGSTLVGHSLDGVRTVAFWLATLLPLSYLPLLATGVTAEHPLGFVALLCSNALAFVLGHGHDPGRADAEC